MKTLFILLTLSLIPSAFAQTRLSIIQVGHPTLREQARELSMAEIQSPEIQTLIDDMVFTMKKAGGVGLAAPQVNESLRLFVMKSGFSVPLTVVINPKLEYLESYGQQKSTEGCLSIPGQTVTVKRFKKLHMTYLNRKGEYIAEEVSGFKAIISQHEYDHLNGVLITDLAEQLTQTFDWQTWVAAPKM